MLGLLMVVSIVCFYIYIAQIVVNLFRLNENEFKSRRELIWNFVPVIPAIVWAVNGIIDIYHKTKKLPW